MVYFRQSPYAKKDVKGGTLPMKGTWLLGRWLWRGPITNPPRVALTFDNGPHPIWTPQVLDILKEEGVPATFFVLGRHALREQAFVRRMVADGHLVGSKTQTHAHLLFTSIATGRAEITLGTATVEQIAGQRHGRWFRPPWGWCPPWFWPTLDRLSQKLVLWTCEAFDFLPVPASFIISWITYWAGPGSIILLYDGGGDRSQTVKALPAIIRILRLRGYQFVTLDGLVA